MKFDLNKREDYRFCPLCDNIYDMNDTPTRAKLDFDTFKRYQDIISTEGELKLDDKPRFCPKCEVLMHDSKNFDSDRVFLNYVKLSKILHQYHDSVTLQFYTSDEFNAFSIACDSDEDFTWLVNLFKWVLSVATFNVSLNIEYCGQNGWIFSIIKNEHCKEDDILLIESLLWMKILKQEKEKKECTME